MKITNALLTIGASFAVVASAAPSQGIPHNVDALSNKMQKLVTIKGLTRHTNKFQEIATRYSNGTRVFGSAAHNATLQYIIDQTKHHYEVTVQPAEFEYTETVKETASIVSGAAGGPTDLKVKLMTYTSSTPAEGLTAEAVVVANLGCDAADYSGVAGKIALISRGTCPFGQKSSEAAKAGAAAALIYNNEDGDLNGTLGTDFVDKVPTAGISKADGLSLVQLASSGPVSIKVDFIELHENRNTANVCAETKRGNKSNVIVLGAHSDSVAAGPGINDNGSGSAALLEVANVFKSVNPKNAVRFCWWSAEEFGLLGATHYVENLTPAQLKDISLYLNFDMIASPNFYNAIYDGNGDAFGLPGPGGSAAIEKLFEDYFAKNHGYSDPTEFDGRSDYGPFIDVGIPSGGTFTGAEGKKTEEQAKKYGGSAGVDYDVCYHAACDTTANLNHEAFLLHGKAIAHAVATYSFSTADVDAQRDGSVTKRSLSKRSADKTTIVSCSASNDIFTL